MDGTEFQGRNIRISKADSNHKGRKNLKQKQQLEEAKKRKFLVNKKSKKAQNELKTSKKRDATGKKMRWRDRKEFSEKFQTKRKDRYERNKNKDKTQIKQAKKASIKNKKQY